MGVLVEEEAFLEKEQVNAFLVKVESRCWRNKTMRFLSYITAMLIMAGATCFSQGMRISAYPNTNNLGFSNLFIVAIKGSPGTNMNISWQQLSNLISTTVGNQFILENNGVGTNTSIYNSLKVSGDSAVTNLIFYNDWAKIIVGDSISLSGTYWPYWLTNKYRQTIPGSGFYTNLAGIGYSIGDLTNEYSAKVKPLLTTYGPKVLLFVWIGANVSGMSDDDTLLTWSNYVATAKADGAGGIVGFSVMNSATTYTDAVGAWNVRRNNFMRESPYLDWYVDAAAMFPNWGNSNHFSDGVHLTTNASAMLADEVHSLLYTKPRGGWNKAPRFFAQEGTNYFLRSSSNGTALFNVIDDNGIPRVGISNAAPEAALDINGVVDSYMLRVNSTLLTFTNGRLGVATHLPTARFQIQNPAGAYTAYKSYTANIFANDDGSNPQLYIAHNGVAGAGKGGKIMFAGENSGTGTTPFAFGYILGASHDGVNYPGYLSFATTQADSDTKERMRITGTGLIGIDTNAPAATLHVSGNNAQNVAQFGTTNKPEQVVLSTNGVLSVNPGGGLNPVGCYGFLGMNDTNLIVCAGAAGVYTNVSGQDGFTTITTNGFFGNTAAIAAGLTNLYPGWYRVTVCLSALGANNQALEGEVFTNGVACDLIGFKKTYDAAARMDDMSTTGIIYLPANCGTQFMLQDGGTGGSVIVHRASLTVGTP